MSDTLTAYKLKFRYLKRNNPFAEKHVQEIKAGKSPEYTFQNFVDDYTNVTKKLAIGENSKRAILLSSAGLKKYELNEQTTRWYLIPNAGKQGTPVKVMKTTTLKEYNFGADSAALYEHHVFVYENKKNIIAIFYRQNGSGCKSVFLETANNILREKGLKLEMELYMPLTESSTLPLPTKITMQYTKEVESSDIADNYKNKNTKKSKKQVVREIGLNLEVNDNKNIFEIIKNIQIGNIKLDDAFVKIKEICQDTCEYNDAEIELRIGNRKKRIQWNELENSFGSYDITKELKDFHKKSNKFIQVLTSLVDEYYNQISNLEEAI